MCIIALKPAGISIPESSLKNMWDNNDDGAGFMYADRGRVRVVKGLMKFEHFLSAYKRVGDHRKIVMHFRIRTHGAVSAALTHPFWIRKGDLAMVHNGIISSVGSSSGHDAEESDTSLYAKVLAHRYSDPLDALTNQAEVEQIVKEIGWSKLVFLTGEDEHIIVNEKSGDWVGGCWYSNSSHQHNYRGFKSWSYYTSEAWETERTRTYGYNHVPKQGYVFGTKNDEWEDTKPHQIPSQGALALRAHEPSDDEEWEKLLARYEARYGSCD
jgi:predicted glutamine amidotransferase